MTRRDERREDWMKMEEEEEGEKEEWKGNRR